MSFSDEEFGKLQALVEKTGLSRERYLRMSALNYTIHENPPIDFYVFIRAMNQVGNNINQLLANSYNQGFVDAPLLRKHLNELNDLEDRLWDEFKPGDK